MDFNSQTFTVKSMYNFLHDGGIKDLKINYKYLDAAHPTKS